MDSSDREQNKGQQEHERVLRVIFCGGEEADKDTLIERLLPDARELVGHRPEWSENGCQAWGDCWSSFGRPLGVDGLQAEGESGDKTDCCCQPFASEKRKFILAEIACDEHYSRNMVALARQADVVVLLVDAREGLVTRTRHCGYLASLLGVRHFVLAIDRMELVGYSRETFEGIAEEFRGFSEQVGMRNWTAIPVSRLHGDKLFRLSDRMDWYQGETLLGHLEAIGPDVDRAQQAPFRFLVQEAVQSDFGGSSFSGYVASGTICAGARVRAQPAGKESHVLRLTQDGGDTECVVAERFATLTLQDTLEIAKGSVISATEVPAEVADQFEAKIVSIHEQPIYPGRTYLINIGNNAVNAVVTEIKYQVNVNTLEHLAADKLERNGIAACNISLDRAIPFDPYEVNPQTGGFVLVDRVTKAAVGAGLLNFALRRAHNIHLQHVDIDKNARSNLKGHRPCVLWFTGLSGSGKSTVANLVEQRLYTLGAHTYLLDGDNVRHGLNRDLGFTDADRVENIRRVAEVSKLMVDAGLIVLTAFISPFRSERRMARGLLAEGEFLEVFMDTPLEVAEQRDPKGLYKKARAGALKNFTGIDSPYEQPEACEVRINTHVSSAEEAADRVIAVMQERGLLLLSG